MKTAILKINNKRHIERNINLASKFLKDGELVAFPTETVYGLGANAFNEKAVKKIFKAKGRPSDNPLIVHISNKKEINKLAREIPKELDILIEKFWPGPITIILKKSNLVPTIVSGGLDTVAIRMPKNNIALELIKKSGIPIAAPSANISGKPSSTSAKHVINDFYGKISCIIDGGKTNIGLESSIIDLTKKNPILLRAGGISFEELKKVIPTLEIHPSIGKKINKIKAEAPGMKYRHYSPNAKIVLIDENNTKSKNKINGVANFYKKQGKKTIILFLKNDKQSAKDLFNLLRKADDNNVEVIVVNSVKNSGLGLAINSRLRKAASEIIKD